MPSLSVTSTHLAKWEPLLVGFLNSPPLELDLCSPFVRQHKLSLIYFACVVYLHGNNATAHIDTLRDLIAFQELVNLTGHTLCSITNRLCSTRHIWGAAFVNHLWFRLEPRAQGLPLKLPPGPLKFTPEITDLFYQLVLRGPYSLQRVDRRPQWLSFMHRIELSEEELWRVNRFIETPPPDDWWRYLAICVIGPHVTSQKLRRCLTDELPNNMAKGLLS